MWVPFLSWLVEITTRRLASRRRQQGSQVGGNLGAVLVQLAPGDPDDAPSRGVESPISGSVPLEGGRCGVRRVSVELGDESLWAPDAIALDLPAPQLDARVHRRARQAMAVEGGQADTRVRSGYDRYGSGKTTGNRPP